MAKQDQDELKQAKQKKLLFLLLGAVAIVVAYQFYAIVLNSPEKQAAVAAAAAKSQTGTAQKAPAPQAKKPAAKPAAGAAKGAAAQEGEGPKPTLDDVDIDKLVDEVQVVTFNYQDNKIDRDPMQPLVLAGMGTGTGPLLPGDTDRRMFDVRRTRVNGIVWDEHDPVAIVKDEMGANSGKDRLIYVGYEYPNGVTVSAIKPDCVTFKVGESLVDIKLQKGNAATTLGGAPQPAQKGSSIP